MQYLKMSVIFYRTTSCKTHLCIFSFVISTIRCSKLSLTTAITILCPTYNSAIGLRSIAFVSLPLLSLHSGFLPVHSLLLSLPSFLFPTLQSKIHFCRILWKILLLFCLFLMPFIFLFFLKHFLILSSLICSSSKYVHPVSTFLTISVPKVSL